MTNEEAARILDPGTSAEALQPYALGCVMRMAVVEDAVAEQRAHKVRRLRERIEKDD